MQQTNVSVLYDRPCILKPAITHHKGHNTEPHLIRCYFRVMQVTNIKLVGIDPTVTLLPPITLVLY